MSGHDTCEEYEGDSQGNTEDLDFAQIDTDGNDNGIEQRDMRH